MKREKDKIGQALLVLVGLFLVFSGGSCAVLTGWDMWLPSLVGLATALLGFWIMSLAVKENAGENNDGDGAEKEKQ